MIIACDVDDVLVDSYSAIAAFHNERYGTSLCKEDFTSYLLWETWGGNYDEAVVKMREYYQTSAFRRLPLMEGVVNAMRLLACDHQLVAITGRPYDTANITEELIARDFNGLFDAVHHTDAFGLDAGGSRPKSAVCAEIGASVIIEDYLGHAIECANNGMRVLLFDQPWNRGQIVCGGVIERVHSWDEVLEKLL